MPGENYISHPIFIIKNGTLAFLTVLFLVLLMIYPSICYSESSLILWNRLGSESEILNSEIGPNFTIQGKLMYKEVRYGNGVFSESHNSRAKIDNLNTMNPQEGTVEFWLKTSPGFPGDISSSNDATLFTMGIPTGSPGAQQGTLNGVLQLGPPPNTSFRWVGSFGFPNYLWDVALDIAALNWGPDEVHHLAFTYNSAEPSQAAKIFVDGVEMPLVVADPNRQNPGWTGMLNSNGHAITIANHFEGITNTRSLIAMDNFKIFNVAKTDFADRQVEGVAVLCNGVVATLVGTGNDDTLMGTPGDDVIVGLGGDDTIAGGGGNDLICGGAGDDDLRGDAGDDTLYGDAGDDNLRGDAGDDNLLGLSGHDDLRGGSGNDNLDGGSGIEDLCRGGIGDGDAVQGCETVFAVP